MKEMVEVKLYEDGNYTVCLIDSYYATQELYGWDENGSFDCWYCKKEKWKYYLLRMLSTSDIDKKIKELKKVKQKREKLKREIELQLQRA